MKCKEIIKKLEQLYPLSFAASWDNSGFQIGDLEKEIHTVYLALDATDEVIDHAIEAGGRLAHYTLSYDFFWNKVCDGRPFYRQKNHKID